MSLLLVAGCGDVAENEAAAPPGEGAETIAIAEASHPLVDARVTVDALRSFSPRGEPELIQVLVDRRAVLVAAEITTPRRLRHFFAQVATETGGLRRIDENLSYSAKRLLEVFPRYFNAESAQDFARQPRRIANHVYGHRLGNLGRHTDDGWTYRGSGFIQLTGRENFRKRGAEVDLPLEERPDLARRPLEGLFAATAYWRARSINAAADENDLERTRRLVNGGTHGLSQAGLFLARAEQVWPDPSIQAAGGADRGVAQGAQILHELGFLAEDPRRVRVDPDSDAFAAALRAFQADQGLTATGAFDDDTLYAMTDPAAWRHAE